MATETASGLSLSSLRLEVRLDWKFRAKVRVGKLYLRHVSSSLYLSFLARDNELTWFEAGNRKRVAICVACGMFSQLSGNGLISYYLSKILNLLGYTDPSFQNKINGIYATTGWVEAMFAAFMVDRIGRRPLFLTSNSAMIVTFGLWIAFTAMNINTEKGSWGIGAIVMIFLHTLVYNIAWYEPCSFVKVLETDYPL